MKRTLIKQGGAGLTFYVPKKWVDQKGLKAGDEVEVLLEEDKLIIYPGVVKKVPKKVEITIGQENYNVYRSLIGGLYRAGYDEVKVYFSDRKIISELQKTVDSLYGLEIFDVDDKSCIIRCVYVEELTELLSHVNKCLHIIKTMQTIITEDIENKKFVSKEELFQFRNTVLKQRDIVSRVIVQNKLIGNQDFPCYMLSFLLWIIARNYYNLYEGIRTQYVVSKEEFSYFQKTNAFFSDLFKDWTTRRHELSKKHNDYRVLITHGIQLLKTKKGSLVVSYCMNILMTLQSCSSHILIRNY